MVFEALVFRGDTNLTNSIYVFGNVGVRDVITFTERVRRYERVSAQGNTENIYIYRRIERETYIHIYIIHTKVRVLMFLLKLARF